MSVYFRKYPVERIECKINAKKTGKRIKKAAEEAGYTVRDLMTITGLSSEQAIYRWFRGETIPSAEMQVILCKLFGFRITDLLVLDEEAPKDTAKEKEREFQQEVCYLTVSGTPVERCLYDYSKERKEKTLHAVLQVCERISKGCTCRL